jgi:exosome complex exonuclease RRP6
MEQSQDFKSLQESVQKSLISTIKTVNRIAAEDLSFQRTVNPSVGQLLEDRTSRILELSTQLLLTAGKACGVKAPKLEDVEDIEMKWRGVVDVVDSSLEKADTALDEYTGLVKRKEPPLPDPVCQIYFVWNTAANSRRRTSPRSPSPRTRLSETPI